MNNSWICVDANLVIRLVADPADKVVQQLWAGWEKQKQPLAAPSLLYYEVSNALYRYQKHNLLSDKAVNLALKAALALPVDLHGGDELHLRAIALARRFNLSAAYDAHYLALAEILEAEFWTADRRLYNIVGHALPRIHLI